MVTSSRTHGGVFLAYYACTHLPCRRRCCGFVAMGCIGRRRQDRGLLIRTFGNPELVCGASSACSEGVHMPMADSCAGCSRSIGSLFSCEGAQDSSYSCGCVLQRCLPLPLQRLLACVWALLGPGPCTLCGSAAVIALGRSPKWVVALMSTSVLGLAAATAVRLASRLPWWARAGAARGLQQCVAGQQPPTRWVAAGVQHLLQSIRCAAAPHLLRHLT